MEFLLALAVVALGGIGARRYFFGFAAQTPAHYAGSVPTMDIARNLSGEMVCDGVIFGPAGRVTNRFVARMAGTWTDSTATLSEDFTYGDGRTQARKWSITMGENGHFTATAPDIVGVAQGQQSGATARMTYRLRLTEAAGGYVLDVVDWLYLTDDGTILNKSEMRKFGVKVAELIATIRPVST